MAIRSLAETGAEPADRHEVLARRVNPAHLRQRLGIERDKEARVFGQGLNFFHPENWYSGHRLIRGLLRLTGLHRRGRRNALRVVLRHNHVNLARLPAAFEGLRVLHLSDLHLDMSADVPHALIDAVRRAEHDICVLTGDYRARTTGPTEPTLEALRSVRAHLGTDVYAVLGNHDSIRMVPGMEAMRVRVLLNESIALARDGASFHLAGIDDPHYYRADNLEKTCEHIPPDACALLLSHSPEMYRHAAHAGFDLMLAGHTHGGQICLPGGRAILVNARCPRAFCAGAWRYQRLTGYTSVGSGASLVDARFNCPPEITVHHLHAGEPAPRGGS